MTAEAEGALQVVEAGEQDLAFLQALFVADRRAEFAPLGWPEPALEAFLRQQHALQRQGYGTTYPDARTEIIVHAGERIGAWTTVERPDGCLLVDMVLLPAWRGQGHGSALLSSLQARVGARPLELRVIAQSRARRLYTRHGFHILGEAAGRVHMRWRLHE